MDIAPHVLLVDDDRSVRRVVERWLIIEGMTVTAVATGVQALQLIDDDSLTFDVLVTDHRLPNMMGAELVEALRLRGNKSPAIVISGDTSGPALRAILPAGTQVLSKPFEMRELIGAIRSAIAR